MKKKVSKILGLVFVQIFFMLFLSCTPKPQPKVVGESPLDLDKVDFEMNLATFFNPPKTDTDDIQPYDFVKDNITTNDTVADIVNEIDKPKVIGVKYTQANMNECLKLAILNNQLFPKIDAIELDNKVCVICASVNLSKKANDIYLSSLIKKYGAYKKMRGKQQTYGIDSYEIYEWVLKNCILRYSFVAQTDCGGISFDEDARQAAHCRTYVCVINPQYKDTPLNKYLFAHHVDVNFLPCLEERNSN